MTTPGEGRHRRQNPPRRAQPEQSDEPRVIRDRRRIDPSTGAVRETGDRDREEHATPMASEPLPADKGAEVADLAQQVAERTSDLQRLQAEYVNYRRRVERDRDAVREAATATVLSELLSVLDDVGRAREHGELQGGFRSVAEALEAAVAKLGLERYGDAGEPFDPTVHEALMHSYSSDVTEPTCVQVLQPGYRLGERVLRPARVAVAEPEQPEEAPAPSPDSADPGTVEPPDAPRGD